MVKNSFNPKSAMILLFLMAFVAIESSGQQRFSAQDAKKIAALIPQNGAPATILRMTADEEYVRLTEKMRRALAGKEDWMNEYIRRNGAGKLKYHASFGVTEAEYEKILAGAENFRLMESGEKAVLKVSRRANETIVSGDNNLENFSNVGIDAERHRITTPFGECSEMSESKSSKAFELVGSWTGYFWHCEKSDEKGTSGYFISFTIGKFDRSADVYLAYSVGRQMVDSPPLLFDIWLKVPAINQKTKLDKKHLKR